MNSLLPAHSFKFSHLTFLGSTILSFYPSSILHEFSHAVAMKTLFTDVNPSIQIGWNQTICTLGGPAKKPTAIGQIFHRDHSFAMIAAAGPIANFALAALGVLGSATIKTPHFNSIALGVSFFNISYLTSYLVSDLCLDMISNADFSEFVAKTGISPIIVFGSSSIALSSLSFLLYKEFHETFASYQEASIPQLFANDMA